MEDGGDSSQGPVLGSSQGHDHIFCQTFPQRPSPSQVPEVEQPATKPILWDPHHREEKRRFLSGSGRPRDWGAPIEVRAEQREMAAGLSLPTPLQLTRCQQQRQQQQGSSVGLPHVLWCGRCWSPGQRWQRLSLVLQRFRLHEVRFYAEVTAWLCRPTCQPCLPSSSSEGRRCPEHQLHDPALNSRARPLPLYTSGFW